MLSGSIQINSSVSIKSKLYNLTIQNFQTFMDDQCKYNTYTCYIYNLLWFIDHPKNTLSYSINHALIKSCISQCSFQFQYFTISTQFKYAHKFNSVMQFNSFFSNQFNYANQFSYAIQFSYALNEFNLCI